MSYNQVPVQQIPEVLAYEQAKAAYTNFKVQHPQLFQQLDYLVEQLNTTMEAAEKAVRAQQATCGDFDLYQKVTKIDGKALHDAIGRETFIAIGGTVKMMADYKVDGKRLQLAVAQNRVAKDIVEEVTKEEQRYHKPTAAVIP